MVAILEKGEHNIDFHPMVDFIEASPLRYALTVKPTVYVSHIRQFWSTARIETTEDGTQILATVDGFHKTITESSLRRNLSLMMRKQSDEGSGTPTEPQYTPSLEAQSPSHTTHTSPSLPPVTTTSIPTVIPTETTPVRQYTRRARIAQSSTFPTVADEPTSPQRDVSQRKACPIDSGFISDQDTVTIDKSSTLSYDSAPRVTSPVADEGKLTAKFQAQEVEINRLKEIVKMLEDIEGVAAIRSGDDAPIKGRSMDEGEAATERISDDSEEMATVLTSMDETTVFASGVVDVPTSSRSIPTTSTPAKEQVPTSSDVVPTKVQEQIDAQVTRELEEQLEREDQRRLDRTNKTVAKYLQEYHQFALKLPIERRIELITDLIEDFIPMGLKEEAERIKRKGLNLEQESAKKQNTSEEVLEEAMSPEEVLEEKKITRLGGSSASYQFFIDLLKHLDREDMNQLWRLVKETLSNRPPTSDKEMELWVELSRLYEPDNKDQMWTHTLNFMHAPVEGKLYDTCGVHHVTSKDKEIFMLVEKEYPLRKGLSLVMISYKLQVENYSQMANDLLLKIYKIGNSTKQQEQHSTASEERCHCQKKSKATARKIALLSKVKKKLSVKVK
nr:hypothetical protein [Tanacetum cinerariifolium]